MNSAVLSSIYALLQVGAEELKDGNLHPNPGKVEGFVVHAFDLDECRTNRLG
jgi:hypothetical protein